jgi:hypothetical protein
MLVYCECGIRNVCSVTDVAYTGLPRECSEEFGGQRVACCGGKIPDNPRLVSLKNKNRSS